MQPTPANIRSLLLYAVKHCTPGDGKRIRIAPPEAPPAMGIYHQQFLEGLCNNLGIRVGQTTPDGAVTVESVMCLAACDKAPMFQVQSDEGLNYYENQTVESAVSLVD